MTESKSMTEADVQQIQSLDELSLPTRKHRLLFAVGVYLTFIILYGLNNRLIDLARCQDLTSALDQAIPFVTLFVFPFYLTYVIVLMPAALVRDWELFKRGGLAFFILMVASNLIFFLFPVTVPRPEFVPHSMSGQLVAWMYASDRPVCGFPSLHVSTTVMSALILGRDRKLWGWIFGPFAVLTALSTLFIKQHVVADVAGGLIMALIVFYLVVGNKKDSQPSD